MKYKRVFDAVLARIRPGEEEEQETLKFVKAFLSLLNSELKRLGISARAVLGGSYAKDTWLSGDYDVDVFVKFDLKYEGRKDISDLLESALLHFSPERIHGSRDYFFVHDRVNFEIVPVLDIKNAKDAKNVTDFSPLHVSWTVKHGAGLTDDIRLAKKFCKAARCYGAESYIRGFSGHVVDLLVIHYGGFLKLLKAASEWRPKVIIDHDNVYKGKVLFMLNESKISGPLIVIDPVQPDRNAAAAVSPQNFGRFVKAAGSFLKAPSERFFVEKEVDLSKADLVVDVQTRRGKVDVSGAKMVRAFEFVCDSLSDFGLKDAGWEWDRKGCGVWWFRLRELDLPERYEWRGPPLAMESAVRDFRKKYKETFERDGRVFTLLKRKNISARSALADALKSGFVRERIDSAKLS